MCFRETRQEEKDSLRARRERRREEPRQRGPNIRPRGNQEPDRRDLERSLERLDTLVGR
jgi:hypothetical protein